MSEVARREIELVRGTVRQLGRCSFCVRPHSIWTDARKMPVTELSGPHTSVRICDPCLQKIKESGG